MGLIKFIREVTQTPHYRSNPRSLLQYAYAKWAFSRHRENDPIRFLLDMGIDCDAALRGFEKWRPQLQEVIFCVRDVKGCQGGISPEDGLILYGLTRALRPDFIVETGVAAGVSTSFFAAALIENSHGNLLSIELPPDTSGSYRLADGCEYKWHERGVGWAVPEKIRSLLDGRHRLILADVREALPMLLGDIPYVDIFFHDDLHTPGHMLWEYKTVWPRIRPGGVLISDDSNFGWIEFCRQAGQDGRRFPNLQRLTAVRKDGFFLECVKES
jgi:hypothetical protein